MPADSKLVVWRWGSDEGSARLWEESKSDRSIGRRSISRQQSAGHNTRWTDCFRRTAASDANLTHLQRLPTVSLPSFPMN